MNQVEKGTQKDFEDIRDFANYVFSQSERPHDFKKLLPKIYDDRRDTAGCHYLVREDNKIKAMVCVWPVRFRVLERTLEAACIGTVSVHPYSRGKGYMKLLMHKVMEDMKAEGYAFSFLGGQRQRYEYYGFEPSGIQLFYTITRKNVRSIEEACSDISLLPFEQKDSWIDIAYSLYNEQSVKAFRDREEFVSILESWASEPYFILYRGDFAGYVSIQDNGMIDELLLKDYSLLKALLKSLVSLMQVDNLYLVAAQYETEKIQILSGIAEDCSIQTSHNYSIFHWKETIAALMNLKAQYDTLAEGVLTIRIDDTALEISVSGHNITVKDTEAKADIEFTSLNGTAVLMSPAGSFLRSEYLKQLNRQKQLCFTTWFPLPLFTASTDCC